MANEDVAGEEAGSGQRVPDTHRFQIQFGPKGECRIVLLFETPGGETPFATLTLGAADADDLARVLTARREAHAQAECQERGAKH